MGVYGASTYRFKGKPNKGESPLNLWKKVLGIQADVFAQQGDGLNINSPAQLDYLINQAENPPVGVIKDEGDKLDVEGMIAKWEARKAYLGKSFDVTTITNALVKDSTEARYQYFNRNAGNPFKYLDDYSSAHGALQLVAQSLADQLKDNRRLTEADSLEEVIKGDNITETQKAIQESIASGNYDNLLNYAAVYQTDQQGRIKDLKVLPVEEIKTGYVALFDDNMGKNLLMRPENAPDFPVDKGIQVYVNVQELNGKKFIKLADKIGNVAPVDTGLSGIMESVKQIKENKELTKKEKEAMVSNMSASIQKDELVVGHFKDVDLNDPMFRNSITTSDPIVNTVPGQYFRFADGRVFRNNNSGKLDEIAPDALKYFSDYNPDTAVRMESLESMVMTSRTGKYLTEKDLFPMTPAPGAPHFGRPMFQEQQTMTPVTSLTPTTFFTGKPTTQQNMTSIPQINRSQGIQKYSGQEKFNLVSKNMFTGNPAP